MYIPESDQAYLAESCKHKRQFLVSKTMHTISSFYHHNFQLAMTPENNTEVSI